MINDLMLYGKKGTKIAQKFILAIFSKIIDKSINLCGRTPKLGCTIDAMNK